MQIDMFDDRTGWGIEAAGQILHTGDSGYTWQDVTPPEVDYFSAGDAVHAWDTVQTRISCQLIGCTWEWAAGLVTWRTSDGGQTWRSWLSTGSESFANPGTGWRLFAPSEGKPSSLQQTTDGGLTWTTIKAVAWQTARFDFTSEQVGWAIVSDGANTAFVHTIDSGKTWTEIKPVMNP